MAHLPTKGNVFFFLLHNWHSKLGQLRKRQKAKSLKLPILLVGVSTHMVGSIAHFLLQPAPVEGRVHRDVRRAVVETQRKTLIYSAGSFKPPKVSHPQFHPTNQAHTRASPARGRRSLLQSVCFEQKLSHTFVADIRSDIQPVAAGGCLCWTELTPRVR